MKLWPVPQDLDENFNMVLSAEYKQKDKYEYQIVKLTIRNRHNGQQHKALQLVCMRKE